jgi:hypothetical protein
MDAILTDLTPATLTSAIEDNLFALFREIGRLPGGELEESQRLILFRTGLPSPFFNGVCRTRDASVPEVTTRFSERFSWWTGPQSSPSDLDDVLEAAGLASGGRDMPGMAIPLEQIDERRAYPPGVEVTRADDEAGIELWARLFSEAHAVPPASGQAWSEAARRLRLRDLPWTQWVASLDGAPAGLGLSFVGAGVVGLYGIGTLETARRRGVGSALTLVPMLQAHDAGYRAAVLQSTPDGEQVYPRLGFRTYCTVSRFLGGG